MKIITLTDDQALAVEVACNAMGYRDITAIIQAATLTDDRGGAVVTLGDGAEFSGPLANMVGCTVDIVLRSNNETVPCRVETFTRTDDDGWEALYVTVLDADDYETEIDDRVIDFADIVRIHYH